MIIIQLKGGLGNQLFQYAAGRRLAVKNNTELLLDLTYFNSNDQPSPAHALYGLHKFNINAQIAELPEIKQFYTNSFLEKIKRKAAAISGIGKIRRVCEKEWFVFEPNVLQLPDNVFLWGYWQSEKYFKDIEDIIRKELSLKEPLSPESAVVEQNIKNMKNTVSLHVRRGDYVTNEKVNAYFGLCQPDYYNNCISILKNKLGALNIFVFSDDPEWAKNNIKSGNTLHFIEHNKAASTHEDMYLMSICKHNIIANSSFSWWGAWFNNNKNKTVFTPKQWIIAEGNLKLDVIPNNWSRI